MGTPIPGWPDGFGAICCPICAAAIAGSLGFYAAGDVITYGDATGGGLCGAIALIGCGDAYITLGFTGLGVCTTGSSCGRGLEFVAFVSVLGFVVRASYRGVFCKSGSPPFPLVGLFAENDVSEIEIDGCMKLSGGSTSPVADWRACFRSRATLNSLFSS